MLRATAISLGGRLPVPSSGLPGGSAGIYRGPKSGLTPCLTLLPVGFAEPGRSPDLLVSSYLTVSPLPRSTSAVCFLWHFP